MTQPLRPLSSLSESINQKLNAYALAAGAAGVGILALAHPAEGKIVYTASNIPIVRNTGPVELDLNHDGINDFQFSNTSYSQARKRQPEGFFQFALTVAPAQASNRVRSAESKGLLAAAHLFKGKTVGPRSRFQPGNSILAMAEGAGDYTSFNSFGPWLKVKQGYLGLKFVIKGKIHFGWARVQMAGEKSPTITGYAYETIPNKPITTGERRGPNELDSQPASTTLSTPLPRPRTLGTLALGAPGVSIWRREESAPERD